ncbi:hypothetical protein AAHA92_06896 [Salvia divinorum]|uniref:Uncharacterized protein n=1 Tax=Salvia divinorum TaxID=28513 RepID=A0ABD1I757_SALDI
MRVLKVGNIDDVEQSSSLLTFYTLARDCRIEFSLSSSRRVKVVGGERDGTGWRQAYMLIQFMAKIEIVECNWIPPWGDWAADLGFGQLGLTGEVGRN